MAQSHQQINSFAFGPDDEISTETVQYPRLQLWVQPSSVLDKTFTLNMSILIIDRMKQDEYNKNDTLSDTLSIARDIYALLNNPDFQDLFLLEYNVPMEPVYEGLPENVNGWRLNFALNLASLRDRCQVPLDTVGAPVITVETQGQNSIIITWPMVATATGYRIDVAIDPGFTNLIMNNVDLSDRLIYEIEGLSPDTGYYIRLRSYNTFSTSDYSNVLFTNTILIPNAPVIVVTSFTDITVVVGWSAISGATKYFIDVAIDSGFTSFVPGYNNLDIENVTSYTITGLTGNTTYYVRLRVKNNFSTSANSNTVSQLTYDSSAQALFAQYLSTVGSAIPAAYRTIYNQLFLNLKGLGATGSANLVNKIDFIKGLAGYTTSSNTTQNGDNRFLLRCNILAPSATLMSNVTSGLDIATRTGWTDSNVKAYRMFKAASYMNTQENNANLTKFAYSLYSKGWWFDATFGDATLFWFEGRTITGPVRYDASFCNNVAYRVLMNTDVSGEFDVLSIAKGMRINTLTATEVVLTHNTAHDHRGVKGSAGNSQVAGDLGFGNSIGQTIKGSGPEVYKICYFKGAVLSDSESDQLYNTLVAYFNSMGLTNYF